MQAKTQIRIAIAASLIVIMICCVIPIGVLTCFAIIYHINILSSDLILAFAAASPFIVYAVALIKKDLVVAKLAYRLWSIVWYGLFAVWSLCAIFVLAFFWPLGVGFKIVSIGFVVSILPWSTVFVMRMGLNGLNRLSEPKDEQKQ